MKIKMEDVEKKTYNKLVLGSCYNYMIACDEESNELYYLESEEIASIGTYMEEGTMRPVAELPKEEQEKIYQLFIEEVQE